MRLDDDRGAALLMAITLALVVVAIGAAVSVASRTETLIATSFRDAHELLYAAEGAASLAIHDLDQSPDWSGVVSGAVASSFTDGASIGSRSLPGGTVVLLCCSAGSLTADVQQRAHAGKDWGTNTPQWQIFAWGPVAGWLPAGRIHSPVYVVVWVADDPADGDGNPAADTNGVVELHVQALGANGGRRVVQALVERPSGSLPPGLRVRAWRDLRW